MNDVTYLFDGWTPIGRTLLVGTVTYLGILLLLRITGNRALSRLTTFDFIVAVAVGAVFGRALTAPDVSALQAIVAIALMVALQWLLAWLKLRSRRAGRLLLAEPVVLYMNGEVQERAMRREKLEVDDLLQAARQKGHASLEDVKVIVLESNGTLSLLKDAQGPAVPDTRH